MRTRSPRRTRPHRSSRRPYSLAHLLSRQPKTLGKDPRYAEMAGRLEARPELTRLRISRRCYTLLNHARVAPENAGTFCRTYRLPKDPFFSLFLEIKRDYLADRERYREARRQYILATLRSLPAPTLAFIKYLGYLEEHYNPSRLHPLWQSELFPGSKKQANAYRTYDQGDWIDVFRRHLRLLAGRYRGLNERFREKLLACYLLDCVPPLTPEHTPARWPDATAVVRAYRRMSLIHHPDRGGDPRLFVELKRARDTLAGK